MRAADLEQQLSQLARRISRPVQLHGPSEHTVLDRPAYMTLWRLVDDGPMRPTLLAALLEVDLSVVSRQLRALEDAGFVQRQADPADARAALVSPTRTGRQALLETRALRASVLREALAGWPEDDCAELVRLLARFNIDLDEAVARRQLPAPPSGEALRGEHTPHDTAGAGIAAAGP